MLSVRFKLFILMLLMELGETGNIREKQLSGDGLGAVVGAVESIALGVTKTIDEDVLMLLETIGIVHGHGAGR